MRGARLGGLGSRIQEVGVGGTGVGTRQGWDGWMGRIYENPEAQWNAGTQGRVWSEAWWASGWRKTQGRSRGPRRGSGHLRSRWGSWREACPSLS